MGTLGAEEVASAEGVVASNRPVAVTGADGDGEIVQPSASWEPAQ